MKTYTEVTPKYNNPTAVVVFQLAQDQRKLAANTKAGSFLFNKHLEIAIRLETAAIIIQNALD